MRIPIMFMVLSLVALVLGAGTMWSADAMSKSGLGSEAEWPRTYFEEPFADPRPVTEMVESELPVSKDEPVFATEDRMRLIGRMAEGIRKVAKQKGAGRWWSCGEVLTDEEMEVHAAEWAYRIVYLAWDYSDDSMVINPWAVAGIAANESGYDVCALGPWPRKWGYDHKTLKRSRVTISHTLKDIKRTLLDKEGVKRWRTIGLDAAPLHQLWNCNDRGLCLPKWNPENLPAISIEEVFSLGKGFEYNVRKLKKDAIMYRTDRPWLYWPGGKSSWYDDKVFRWAQRLGVKNEEAWR